MIPAYGPGYGELVAEVERLKFELADARRWQTEWSRMSALNAEMLAALKWYADFDNCEIMAYDAGDRARAALAKVEQS